MSWFIRIDCEKCRKARGQRQTPNEYEDNEVLLEGLCKDCVSNQRGGSNPQDWHVFPLRRKPSPKPKQ